MTLMPRMLPLPFFLPALYALLAAQSFADDPQDIAQRQSFTMRVTSALPRPAATYKGIIVNGNCPDATKPGKSPTRMRKEILRHCRTTASTTTFAVLTDQGAYWKLDEAGNNQVIGQWSPTTSTYFDPATGKIVSRIMRASVKGAVEGASLKVDSIAKF